MRHLICAGVAAVALVANSRPASAQDRPVDSRVSVAPVGWSVTPAMAFSGNWDDNVLVRGRGDELVGDYASAINPRLGLNFTGRRGKVNAGYNGAFVMYRNLASLNSFDQRANLMADRQITRRVNLFTRNSLAIAPTTELSELAGLPFVRTGSRLLDLHGGMAATFTKRTSLTGGYSFQSVSFEEDPTIGVVLKGGHLHGGDVVLRYLLNERAALTADYNRQHATVPGGDPITGADSFDIQGGHGGVEYKLSNVLRVNGSLGVSRLSIGDGVDTRTGLSWHAGLSRDFERAGLDVSYSRAFTPSYGFGGTSQNEELTTRVRVPVGRRMYTSGSFAWHRNTPLVDDLRLTSMWTEALVGYSVVPWMQVEGFYTATHQNIARPGGLLDRRRVGFQVVTAKPVRIR
jgi:hypothetical protein